MRKAQNVDLLSKVYIAAPCPVKWDLMDGDERIRHCSMCKLSVYNVENLSTEETLNLLECSETKKCLRIFRKLDGTIITKNCPVGLKYLHIYSRAAIAAALAVIVWFGLMDSAQAQGLAGAPADPRYGQSGPADFEMVGYFGRLGIDENSVEKIFENPVLSANIVASFSIIWGTLLKKRVNVVWMVSFLALFVFALGFLFNWIS